MTAMKKVGKLWKQSGQSRVACVKLNGDVKTEIIYILYCMGKGKYKERVSETRRGIAQRQICVSQMQDPGFCPQC